MAIELAGDTAIFRLAVGDLHEEELRVLRFRATEGISQQFSVDLELVAEDAAVDFGAVIGQPAAFIIDLGDTPRFFNGVISSFEQGAVGQRFTRYYAQLVPRVWMLNHRVDSRIFQEMSVPDIVEAVLVNAGIPTDTYDGLSDLRNTYKEREYCVQYAESDWSFISRLCEDEGIFYYFEHLEDEHVLRFGDNPSAHPAIVGEDATIVYRDPTRDEVDCEYVGSFRLTESIRPGAVQKRDFSFEAPKTNLESQSKSDEFADLEVFEHDDVNDDAKVVEQLTSVRLEELQSLRRVAGGESVCHRLCAGSRFELAEHLRESFNGEYVLTEVTHTGFEPQALEQEQPEPGLEAAYSNEFQCIPVDALFRPVRLTPRPTIQGTQSATVVCPSGEEVYTDTYGRIRVRFHWDRWSPGDETSSCWIRVSHPIAGAGWGNISIPRSGQEVLVAFHEGNPDRPHVIGSLFNAENKPPYELPAEKSKSAIKTASLPGAGGFNEIRFEDKAGEEQLFVHAQKQMDVRVMDCHYETIEAEDHRTVGTDLFDHVKNERHVSIGSDDFTQIKKDQHLKVDGKQAVEVGGSRSLTVKGDVIEVFKAAHSEQTTGNYYVKAAGVVIEATSGITLKCGGSSIVLDASGVTLKGAMVTVDGSMVKIASGPGSSPMAGSAGSAVAPSLPNQAEVADEADPGKMAKIKAEQTEAGAGKYAAIPIKPLILEDEDVENEEKSWIEIELVDEAGDPVPGERYEVTLPDGETVARGTLDEKGFARVDGIDPGSCKVTFPELDKEAWEPEG